MEPRRPGVPYQLDNIRSQLRELEQTAVELKLEFAASPHHALANLRLGQVLAAQSGEEASTPYLERAVAALPDSIAARRELGKALSSRGCVARPCRTLLP